MNQAINPVLQTLTTQILTGLMQGQQVGAAAMIPEGGRSTLEGELIKAVIMMFLNAAVPSVSQAAPAVANSGLSAGGVQNLLVQFQNAGLGDLVASWLSAGPNKAISPEVLLNVLGKDSVAQFGQKTGLNQGEAASSIADILPELINQVSPQGKIDNVLVLKLLSAISSAQSEAKPTTEASAS